MRPMPESSPPARFKRAVREHPLAAFLLTAPLAWRVTTFRVLAALGGCVFLVPLQQAISPWGAVTLSNTDGVTVVNLHRWSAALAGGPDAGLAALLFYLAWRPMRAQLVLQWAALAAIVFLAANVPFAGPAVAVYAIPVVLVVAAYPEPRALLKAPWVDGVRLLLSDSTNSDRPGYTESERAVLGKLLLVAGELAQKLGIEKTGYRVVINSGPDAGESVPHLHVHLLGKRALAWPPG